MLARFTARIEAWIGDDDLARPFGSANLVTFGDKKLAV